jgi:hypothetical protein
MGQQTTTESVETQAAGGQETALLNALQQILQQSQGQLGDLSDLAQGQVGGPTAEDRRLVEQSIGSATDAAEVRLRAALDRLGANLDEELAAKGIQGSSIEGFKEAGLRSQAFDQILGMTNQARGEGANALLNLPFQRAGVQLGANQALFQRIAGAAAPSLQSLLQSRLANVTQTTKQPFVTGGEILGAASNFASL